MRFTYLLAGTAFIVTAQIASARVGGWVTLINATPYDWKLVDSHQYQMRWNPTEIVATGTAREFNYEFRRNKDDGAEATYDIVGHPTNASFTIQARDGGRKRIEAQYHKELSSLNHAENALLDLKRDRDGAVPFILAGDGVDTPFISSNPPIAWMQATLPTVGPKSLRKICIPASHDAGASEIARPYMGVKHNVVTQSVNVFQQLKNGARFLDIRPVLRKEKWYTAHITVANKNTAYGGLTRTLKDVVMDINQFTAAYPGELIILDISHDLQRKNWQRLSHFEWQILYRELLKINEIWSDSMPLPYDITFVPLSTFIRAGSKSAVIIRLPDHAPQFDPNFDARLVPRVVDSDEILNTTFSDREKSDHEAIPQERITSSPTDIPHAIPRRTPSPEPQPPHTPKHTKLASAPFFHQHRFPITGKWTNTNNPTYLSTDQLSKLRRLRPTPMSPMHQSTWTITQDWTKVIDVATGKHSIMRMSAWARRVLFRDLWEGMSMSGEGEKEAPGKERWPNLIETDDFWSSGVTALCMAINDRFLRGEGSMLGRRD